MKLHFIVNLHVSIEVDLLVKWRNRCLRFANEVAIPREVDFKTFKRPLGVKITNLGYKHEIRKQPFINNINITMAMNTKLIVYSNAHIPMFDNLSLWILVFKFRVHNTSI